MNEENIKELTEEIEENVLPPDNIVVLNELRSAADLNRLMNSEDSIEIQPGFQRDQVWTDEAKARFIDSLAKEFPIPSMCFALDPKEQKYIVIDGLQRMSTIKKFFKNHEWILPNLRDIDQKIAGKSVLEIKKQNPDIYRRIENISLPITILRYDPRRPDNMDYIFTIFQRLNTFGERLNNQEIRNAIYQGPFNTFIRECAKNKIWASLKKSQMKGRSSRMLEEERLLRFFAFFENSHNYEGKLNQFLNDYMTSNRLLSDNSSKKTLFESVMAIIKKIGVANLGKSYAFQDAVLYGIAKNIDHLRDKNSRELKILMEKLRQDKSFTREELSGGMMAKNKVQQRLSAADRLFKQ